MTDNANVFTGRFHRSLRAEFLTGRVFATLTAVQAELDASDRRA